MHPIASMPDEIKHLLHLRAARRSGTLEERPHLSFGDRVAERVAATMGSWNFIIVQSLLLAVWIVLNITASVRAWDPYPFILLNLALSFQAAYAAPFIMMSQNRQASIDRAEAQTDYKVNAKAELEIELLHQKIDLMKETELTELIGLIRPLETRLAEQGRDDVHFVAGFFTDRLDIWSRYLYLRDRRRF